MRRPFGAARGDAPRRGRGASHRGLPGRGGRTVVPRSRKLRGPRHHYVTRSRSRPTEGSRAGYPPESHKVVLFLSTASRAPPPRRVKAVAGGGPSPSTHWGPSPDCATPAILGAWTSQKPRRRA